MLIWFILLGLVGADVIIPLSGSKWTVTNGTKSFPATVPGQIHTDLMAAGVLGEPYYGNNPNTYKWVAYSNWTYSSTFRLTEDAHSHRVVQLYSLGIDTVAEIRINGQVARIIDNMFHTVRQDIKQLVKIGENTIDVHFTSKVLAAAANFEACNVATAKWCPDTKPNPAQHGFQHVNYLRTEPCSFSWDWGPAFAPVGLWRDISIRAFDTAMLDAITVSVTPTTVTQEVAETRINHPQYYDAANKFSIHDTSEAATIARAFRRTDRFLNLTSWSLRAEILLDGGISDTEQVDSTARSGGPMTGTVKVTTAGGSKAVQVTLKPGVENRVQLVIDNINGVNAWFPNGFGEQPLYTLTATWTPSTGAGHDTNSKSVQFGYRTVDLVQNPLPGGKSFYFSINGIPIPVHGSNWIPADSFESRITDKQLDTLFIFLKNSHQNMIRNWGGGIYQRDYLYQLADKHGIMIWEDMMWACNRYEVAPDYLQSSAKEVRDNVWRIQHHPSIVIWAGNNENEGDNIYQQKKYADFYSDLYFKTVLANISSIDQSRPLTGSSPSDGNETAADPVSPNCQSQYYGDVHTYEYTVDCWDPTNYKRPRFTSEFGLQSWPAAITMNKFFPPNERSWNGSLIENRNHHPNGQQEINNLITMHYKGVSDPSGPLTEFAAWLYLSQAYQAYCYKTEVEHFRRIRDQCEKELPGCNMGQMYWQTNDIWPGASWAGVDWTGRYKMMAYYANDFYSKVLVSSYLLGLKDFGLYVVNDHLNTELKGTIDLNFVHWTKGLQKTTKHYYEIKPASSHALFQTDIHSMLPAGCAQLADCFITLQMKSSESPDEDPLATNFMFLDSLSKTTLPNPMLAIEGVQYKGEKDGTLLFDVSFTAQANSVFTWLETKYSGYFSENGMLVTVYGQPVKTTLQFTTTELVDSIQLMEDLQIWSLYNTAKYD